MYLAIDVRFVKSSRSNQAKYYHLSGWYWGKAASRHSIPAAAFGVKQTLKRDESEVSERLLSAISGRREV